MGLEEEIEAIEEEIAETPYNKSTEAHIGRLKAKLAEKKEELDRRQSGGGGGGGYAVEQTGDATVALAGFPSVGKSTLLNQLTNAESEVGAYEFTTLDVQPGILEYRGARIQLLDVPGLIGGAADGRGGGRQVLSVVRSADLLVVVLSAFEIEQYAPLRDELEANGIRPNAEPPSVTIHERESGGVDVTVAPNVESGLDDETVKEVLREHGYVNATVTIREPLDVDRLVDAIMDNRVYLPSVVCVNKADLVEGDYAETVREELREQNLDPDEVTFISAETGDGLDALQERIWEALGLMRIYMKKPGRGVDREEPLIVREGATIDDAMDRLGGDFDERFRFGRVTGPSAAHEEQQVGREHQLADEDVLELVLRR